MTRLRLGFALTICAIALGAASAAEEFSAPATIARGRILVEGSIESIGPYPFLLDTCITQGVLHEGVDEYFSLPRIEEAKDGVSLVQADPFEFGPLDSVAQTFLVSDLGPLAERLGTALGGILPAHQPGLELTLDFPASQVQWRSLDSAQLIDATVPGSVPLRLDDRGTPQVQVLLEGKRLVPARIDSAYGGILALPEKTLKEAGIDLSREMVTLLPNGTAQRQVLLESAAVGSARLRQCLCEIVGPDEPARMGLAFLRHYRVTLNFEYGLARFEREESLDLIAPAAVGTGVVPADLRDGVWTLGVVSGSPAAVAGLTPQHELVQVNSQKANALTVEALQVLLNGRSGERVTVIAQLGGEQRKYDLICAELLPH